MVQTTFGFGNREVVWSVRIFNKFVDNLLCSCQAKRARAPTSPDICCIQQDPAVANYVIQIQLYKHLCLQVILEFRFQLNLPFWVSNQHANNFELNPPELVLNYWLRPLIISFSHVSDCNKQDQQSIIKSCKCLAENICPFEEKTTLPRCPLIFLYQGGETCAMVKACRYWRPSY